MPEAPQHELPNNEEGDFEPNSFYANTFQVETTVYDFKLRFGQLNLKGKEWISDPKCDVTLPWMQLKLMLFFLALNLFNYEEENGTIFLPDRIKPIAPDIIANPPEGQPPAGESFLALYRELYDRLFPTK